MKFHLCTSGGGYMEGYPLPCEGAVVAEHPSPYQSNKGCMVPHWEIEINTLEELIDLLNKANEAAREKYGGGIQGIIIAKARDIKGLEYEIEIYDGYRE